MNSNKKITISIVLVLLAVAIATCVTPSASIVHLTILHTNDTHSQFEALDSTKGTEAGLGGAAKRATLIKQARKENPNTLLFDAGDFCQGTPYFNFYKGEIEIKLLNELKYDAVTFGNHEFDNGVDALSKILENANFPVISSNYDYTGTALQGKTQPYKIFERQGVKIGVLGLTVDKTGLVSAGNSQGVTYLDPVTSAQAIADTLKSKGCDLIIALSHLGYKGNDRRVGDVELATQTRDIDIIIGGHSHTPLTVSDTVKNLDGKDVVIAQTGGKGMQLGRVDVTMTVQK